MIRNNQNSIEIRDYVESVYRQRGKLLLFNLIILLLTIGTILFWPREYRSQAKVWIKIGRENSRLDPTAATGKTISVQETDREDEIKSVIDIMGSRGVIEGAVDQLGPKVVLGDEPPPGATGVAKKNALTEALKGMLGVVVKQIKKIDPVSEREEAVQEIIEHMVVSAERKSNVVSLQYDTDSPRLSQAIVESLIDRYKKTHARIHSTEGSRTFFGEQLGQLKDRVESTAEELRVAKDKLGLASLEGHRTLLESQMENVAEAKLNVSRQFAEAQATIAELEKQISEQPESILSDERLVPNTGRDSIRDQLYTLQVQRMQMEATMSKDNPKLRAILEQEEKARRALAKDTTSARKEVTRSINSIHQDLSLELAKAKATAGGLKAMLDSLNQQHDQVTQRIAQLNKSNIEIEQLQRNVQLAVNNYMSYSEDMEDARMDEELSDNAFSNVSVAQAPTFEEKPISPSKMIVGILGVAAMIFGSLAIAAGALILGNTINRQRDVAEVLDVPVFASIPYQRQFRQILN